LPLLLPFVVFAEELEDAAGIKSRTVQTLEQAFAQIACRCGLAYRFEPGERGWKMVLVDVEQWSRDSKRDYKVAGGKVVGMVEDGNDEDEPET
jgi:hypothetical protein